MDSSVNTFGSDRASLAARARTVRACNIRATSLEWIRRSILPRHTRCHRRRGLEVGPRASGKGCGDLILRQSETQPLGEAAEQSATIGSHSHQAEQCHKHRQSRSAAKARPSIPGEPNAVIEYASCNTSASNWQDTWTSEWTALDSRCGKLQRITRTWRRSRSHAGGAAALSICPTKRAESAPKEAA